ncbi:MAG TPA: energy transducer TonB [Candidatus Angelobacter sp.]|jgi:protein TonB
MFGDTLLESSSALRKRKRWPMAAAFTAEVIVAGIVVMIPLLSTGVISLSARMSLPIPVKPVMIDRVRPVPTGHPSTDPMLSARPIVMLANNNKNSIYLGPPVTITTDWREVTPPGYDGPVGSHHIPSDLIGSGPSVVSEKPGSKRVISQLTEAQLVNRVEPVYPHIAALSGIQGQVRLHAIIARDGSIQSLNVTSGHPVLAIAALEAVRQWRYRPYILNGEAVEVETFITVNFRKEVR